MLTAVIALVLAGVAGAAGGAAAATTRPVAPAGYRVVWEEEFGKAGAVDGEKWGYEVGMLRNHEAQAYVEGEKNARVEGGCLVIEGRREEVRVPKGEAGAGRVAEYTSGSIYSKQSWTYGRVEVRARVPVGRGTWPAIWFLGDGIREGVGWPRCGEIDLMEAVGYDPVRVHQSVHTEAYNWVKGTQKTAVTKVEDLGEAFHVYALEWGPERVEMFIDGKKEFEFKNEHKGEAEWPFDRPIHLKLNLAIGGDWGGKKGIDEGAFPQRFLVDYVRVYQKERE